jgi:hypothetical protein
MGTTYWSFHLAIWETPKHVSIGRRNADKTKVSHHQQRAERMILRISTLDPCLPDNPLFIAFSTKDSVSLLGARLTASKMVKSVILNRKLPIVEQCDIPLGKIGKRHLRDWNVHPHTFSPGLFSSIPAMMSDSSFASGRTARFPYLTLVMMYLPVSSAGMMRE